METARQRSGNPLAGLVLAAVLIGVVWIVVISGIGQVVEGRHAVERHGTEAEQVRQWVQEHGHIWHRYNCPDGRVRVVVPMGSGKYAVVVLEKSGQMWVEVTAFITTDQAYVHRSIMEPCRRGVGVAHP